MISATIFEAKTNLSRLVLQAQGGEEVVITSGRAKKPIARLQAIEPARHQRLGVNRDLNFVLSDTFWEPLPEEELRLWEGQSE